MATQKFLDGLVQMKKATLESCVVCGKKFYKKTRGGNKSVKGVMKANRVTCCDEHSKTWIRRNEKVHKERIKSKQEETEVEQ